mgnify:CR=1 FL=1
MKYNTLHCATAPGAQDCLSVSLLGKEELHSLLHYPDEFELTLIFNADRV